MVLMLTKLWERLEEKSNLDLPEHHRTVSAGMSTVRTMGSEEATLESLRSNSSAQRWI